MLDPNPRGLTLKTGLQLMWMMIHWPLQGKLIQMYASLSFQPKEFFSLSSVSNRMLYYQVLSQDMLRKYITYAKLNVFPKIHDADLDKISHVYAELRRESSVRYPS